MPEALTESFCERCGTRYEFPAPAKLSTLRKTRGLVSGFKNYIMSQDALSDTIEDAMRQDRPLLQRILASEDFVEGPRAFAVLKAPVELLKLLWIDLTPHEDHDTGLLRFAAVLETIAKAMSHYSPGTFDPITVLLAHLVRLSPYSFKDMRRRIAASV